MGYYTISREFHHTVMLCASLVMVIAAVHGIAYVRGILPVQVFLCSMILTLLIGCVAAILSLYGKIKMHRGYDDE